MTTVIYWAGWLAVALVGGVVGWVCVVIVVALIQGWLDSLDDHGGSQ